MTGSRPQPASEPAPSRALDPDALRYARHWEPVLAPAAQRLLGRLRASPADVLDVGAGTGALTLAAARIWPAAHVIALDASAAMLAVARARAAEQDDDRARFEWIVADARRMPLAEASVDAAVSSFVLQRVEGAGDVLREIRRVLREGAGFAFVTWSAGHLRVAADETYQRTLAELGAAPERSGAVSPSASDYASPGEVRAALLAAGFGEVDAWGEELEARWTAADYLALQEHYHDHERFEALDGPARQRLRALLHERLAGLPKDAFTLRSPLIAGVARRV